MYCMDGWSSRKEGRMNTITYILKEFPGKHIMLENVRSFTMTDVFYRVTFNNGTMIKIKRNRIREFQCLWAQFIQYAVSGVKMKYPARAVSIIRHANVKIWYLPCRKKLKGWISIMNDLDKIILNGFRIYLEKHDIDIHDHVSLRLAGATYGHTLMNTILDFIEWSVHDDCNNTSIDDVE